MGRVTVVTGIPGTGKTTVCNELSGLAKQSGKKITIINYGSVMLELSQERGKSIHRDEIRKFSVSFQHELQIEAARVISQRIAKTEGDVIIDTHMSIKTNDGYWAGLPFDVLQFLSPSLLVLVEAEPCEVLLRRFRDITRKRDKVLESEIAEEFVFSRLMAATCAVLTGASVKIVKNSTRKQVEAAKEILKLLEK